MKYYNCEPSTDGNLNLCIRSERYYIDNIKAERTDLFFDMLREYNALGLANFRDSDGVPLILKAILANRYFKYNERIDIEGFKRFYDQYYT